MKPDFTKLPVWDKMSTIELSEMKDVKLMNRIDTKFIAKASLLPEILERATDQYRVQVINGAQISSYDSTYYDTDDLQMYHCHHNRQLKRKKVRTRVYLDTLDSFLEIKHKSNKGRTKKKRIPIDVLLAPNFTSNTLASVFVDQQVKYQSKDLLPQLKTIFDRITLVDKAKTERLTIDIGVTFDNLITGASANLNDVVIIELKQNGLLSSHMRDILMDMRISPKSISKYCIGTALTNEAAKINRFKRKINYIHKIIK